MSGAPPRVTRSARRDRHVASRRGVTIAKMNEPTPATIAASPREGEVVLMVDQVPTTSANRRTIGAVSRWLVLLHVFSAFWFVSGLVGTDVTLVAARRRTDIRSVKTLTEAAGIFDRFAVVPGPPVAVALGLLAMWGQGRSPFEDGNWWLTAALLLFASLVVLPPTLWIPRGRVFEAALEDAVQQGQVTPRLSAALQRQNAARQPPLRARRHGRDHRLDGHEAVLTVRSDPGTSSRRACVRRPRLLRHPPVRADAAASLPSAGRGGSPCPSPGSRSASSPARRRSDRPRTRRARG